MHCENDSYISILFLNGFNIGTFPFYGRMKKNCQSVRYCIKYSNVVIAELAKDARRVCQTCSCTRPGNHRLLSVTSICVKLHIWR